MQKMENLGSEAPIWDGQDLRAPLGPADHRRGAPRPTSWSSNMQTSPLKRVERPSQQSKCCLRLILRQSNWFFAITRLNWLIRSL